MDKKLTTKIQKIVPKLPEQSQNIAKALVIEPDDENILEKKGTIYTIFDITGRNTLDVLLVSKVVNDVLHDAYYQSESASPIQSIEKAILKLRDSIAQIAKESSDTEPMVTFNIATTILWGNTLYIVQYGNTHANLMRGGEVKPINAASEGNFSVASGVVKDNDVLIMATEDFVRKYPPDRLVNIAELQAEQLDMLEGAMIIKFSVAKTFSQQEVVDFGAKPQNENVKEEKSKKKEKDRLRKKLKKEKKERKEKNEKAPRPEKTSRNYLPIIGLFVVVAVVAIGAALYQSSQTISDTTQNEITSEGPTAQTEPQTTEEEESRPSEEEDRINRVVRIEPNVFYDLKITDENATASEIALLGETLVVGDTANSVLYTSDIDTPKLVATGLTLQGIRNIGTYGENLGLIDRTGFKAVNLTTSAVTESYETDELGLTKTYLDFIYSLNEDTITRYSKEEGVLNGNVWTQNETLVGAKSMAIDVSIYVITAQDELLKFTTGEIEDFTVEALDKPFNNVVKIETNPEVEDIYIADAGNRRIVVLSENGVLKQQYIPTEESIWTNIKDIAVNDEETKIYVLDGDKVYDVDLVDNAFVQGAEDENTVEESQNE